MQCCRSPEHGWVSRWRLASGSCAGTRPILRWSTTASLLHVADPPRAECAFSVNRSSHRTRRVSWQDHGYKKRSARQCFPAVVTRHVPSLQHPSPDRMPRSASVSAALYSPCILTPPLPASQSSPTICRLHGFFSQVFGIRRAQTVQIQGRRCVASQARQRLL